MAKDNNVDNFKGRLNAIFGDKEGAAIFDQLSDKMDQFIEDHKNINGKKLFFNKKNGLEYLNNFLNILSQMKDYNQESTKITEVRKNAVRFILNQLFGQPSQANKQAQKELLLLLQKSSDNAFSVDRCITQLAIDNQNQPEFESTKDLVNELKRKQKYTEISKKYINSRIKSSESQFSENKIDAIVSELGILMYKQAEQDQNLYGKESISNKAFSPKLVSLAKALARKNVSKDTNPVQSKPLDLAVPTAVRLQVTAASSKPQHSSKPTRTQKPSQK